MMMMMMTFCFHLHDSVMALATFLMCGRMGTILGTVAFPALMDFGCLPPFFAISTVLMGRL